jgi:hypothetical protein
VGCIANDFLQVPNRRNSIKRYTAFKAFEKRILVATDIFGRGIDVERVNIVVNYDCPPEADSYLHRVGRAGRFGTKGLAVTFVSSESDQQVMAAIQARFEVAVPELPDHIDPASYSKCAFLYTACGCLFLFFLSDIVIGFVTWCRFPQYLLASFLDVMISLVVGCSCIVYQLSPSAWYLSV